MMNSSLKQQLHTIFLDVEDAVATTTGAPKVSFTQGDHGAVYFGPVNYRVARPAFQPGTAVLAMIFCLAVSFAAFAALEISGTTAFLSETPLEAGSNNLAVWKASLKPVWQGSKDVMIEYGGSGGRTARAVTVKQVVADPAGRTYLYGICKESGGVRYFRLDKVGWPELDESYGSSMIRATKLDL